MKKLVLVLVAGVTFATAHAQIQLGVKAGANLTTLTGDGAQGASTLAGFNGGIYAKIPFAHGLSFSPEIVYSGQGAKYSESGVTATQHLNYLNVPLLFRYTHFSGLSIYTGPQIGFLLAANAKAQNVSISDKPDFNSAEFAWDFGVGFDIPKTPVGIDFRYDLGISNLENNSSNDNSGSGSSATSTARNGVFQLGLRYTLFSTKK